MNILIVLGCFGILGINFILFKKGQPRRPRSTKTRLLSKLIGDGDGEKTRDNGESDIAPRGKMWMTGNLETLVES